MEMLRRVPEEECLVPSTNKMEYLNPEFLNLFAPGELSKNNSGVTENSESTEIPQSELELKQKILTCANLNELIKTVKPHFQNEWDLHKSSLENSSIYELFTKRSDISAYNVNSKGQLELDKKRLKEAAKYFNRGIAYAPFKSSSNSSRKCTDEVQKSKKEEDDDENSITVADMGLAHYKRALLLSDMKDYDGALKELELALTLQKSSPTKFKLGRGIQKFQEQLNERIVEQRELENDSKYLEEKRKRKEFCDNLFKLKSPNPNAPAMEDFVQIKFSPTKGRHLVVTKDIPMGCTLLVEKPFVSTLDGTLTLDSASCHFCLKRNLRCIPCPNCVFTLFCDEKCMAAAQSTHKFECPCLPDLHLVLKQYTEYMQAFYLAFKLICIIGPTEIWKLFLTRQQILRMPDKNFNLLQNGSDQNVVDQVPGLNSEKKYESDSYLSILNLISDFNPEQIDPQLPITALKLVAILHHRTDFFSKVELECSAHSIQLSEFQDFVAELIFHHFQCFCRNVYGLCQMDGLDGLSIQEPVTKAISSKTRNKKNSEVAEGQSEYYYYGRGAFATASLINHSCVANTTRFTGLTHGLTAFVSLTPIKKGEEVVVTYIPSFWKCRSSASKRSRVLNHVYEFTCDCPACSNDWPTMTELEMKPIDFNVICSTCPPPLQNFNISPNKNNNNNNDNDNDNDKNDSIDANETNSILNIECICEKTLVCHIDDPLMDINDEFTRHENTLSVAKQLVQSNFPLEAIAILKPAIEFFQKNIKPPSHHLYVAQSIFDRAVELVIYFSK